MTPIDRPRRILDGADAMHRDPIVVAALVLAGLPAACAEPARTPAEGEEEVRGRMIEHDLVGRDIGDPRVLAAMAAVARERFVPPDLRGHAYDDGPLPIGHGQTISQPYIVAFMTQALELSGDESVLEIGTGSGYQAAVLGECAKQVFTIEIVEPLAESSRALLAELGYDNVHVRLGDGYRGWPEEAPFDAIILTAAPDHVPEPLVEQLAEGGRMILPVGGWRQELVLLEKSGGEVTRRSVLPVRFVPMTGEARR